MEKFDYKNAKILVVDDVQEVLDTTRRNLKTIGVEAVTKSIPQEALEYLRNNTVDLILLDFFMPQMTGEEFINELRTFDKKTIVILHTGYADEIPSDEMMDKLNIQGYIDKSKSTADIMLSIKSALKTAYLFKTIYKQEEIIDAQQYKDEFFGKFMYRLLGEVRERGVIIGGLIDAITTDRENYSEEELSKYSSHIKEALDKLMNMVETLEIDKYDMITVGQLKEILNSLFKIKLNSNQIALNINSNEDFLTLECDPKTIIYILVDIIEYIISKDQKEINIVIERNEKVEITVNNSIDFEQQFIEKIKKLARLVNNIEIVEQEEKLKIEIL